MASTWSNAIFQTGEGRGGRSGAEQSLEVVTTLGHLQMHQRPSPLAALTHKALQGGLQSLLPSVSLLGLSGQWPRCPGKSRDTIGGRDQFLMVASTSACQIGLHRVWGAQSMGDSEYVGRRI